MGIRLAQIQTSKSLFKKLFDLSVLNRKKSTKMQKCYMILFFHHCFLRNSKASVRKGRIRACEKAHFARGYKAATDLNKALRGLLKRASPHTYPRNQKEDFATSLPEHC